MWPVTVTVLISCRNNLNTVTVTVTKAGKNDGRRDMGKLGGEKRRSSWRVRRERMSGRCRRSGHIKASDVGGGAGGVDEDGGEERNAYAEEDEVGGVWLAGNVEEVEKEVMVDAMEHVQDEVTDRVSQKCALRHDGLNETRAEQRVGIGKIWTEHGGCCGNSWRQNVAGSHTLVQTEVTELIRGHLRDGLSNIHVDQRDRFRKT